jgi:conjugal transfer pilus assembly protein TrbC
MAKKELLFFMILFFYGQIVFAENINSNQVDKSVDWKAIHQQRQESIKEEDFVDFERVQQDKISKLGMAQGQKATLLVFVSSSMTKHNIEQLLQSAKHYKATLVLRGFIDGSFKKTASFIVQFFKEDDSETGIIIDPTLFNEFSVTTVPSFVLAQEKKFDKIAGNIPLESALEIFKQKGELNQEAESFLRSNP